MKKLIALILAALLCICTCLPALAAKNETYYIGVDGSYLSPNYKCPITPMIYSSERYKDNDKDKAYDISSGAFSADAIKKWQGRRQFGLYLKFTPGGGDSGYYIYRFDVIVKDKNGKQYFADGFDSDMECKYGYYWYWNFFSLDSMFYDMIQDRGSVKKGTYTMDIYFNGMWAGSTQFKVKQ